MGRLSEAAATAVDEFMLGPLLEDPKTVGKPLQRELAGLYSARRGPYRVIYSVDGRRRRVNVVRIEHRSDVYRRR